MSSESAPTFSSDMLSEGKDQFPEMVYYSVQQILILYLVLGIMESLEVIEQLISLGLSW